MWLKVRKECAFRYGERFEVGGVNVIIVAMFPDGVEERREEGGAGGDGDESESG